MIQVLHNLIKNSSVVMDENCDKTLQVSLQRLNKKNNGIDVCDLLLVCLLLM